MQTSIRRAVAAVFVSTLIAGFSSGCTPKAEIAPESMARIEAAANRAESAANKAEMAARSATEAAQRADASAQKAEVIFSRSMRK